MLRKKKLVSLFNELPFDCKLNGKLWRELHENEGKLNKEDIGELFELKKDQIDDFLSNYISLGILKNIRTKYVLKKNKTEIKKIVANEVHRRSFLAWKEAVEDEINKKKIEKIKSYSLNFCEEKIHDELDKTFSFSSESGSDFLRLKETLFKRGILTYQDAFDLSNRYLKDNTDLKNSFSNRFKYVFVDEMQDTDTHQLEIIEKLFKNAKTIIQYYGDPNQAIYDNIVKEKKVWEPKEADGFKLYKISDSKRFGETIANILNKFKIVSNITLSGNGMENTLNPKLINFEGQSNEVVLNKFAEIINQYHEQWTDELALKNAKPVYKAIGWVGSPKEKEEQLTIPSYFSAFERKSEKTKQSHENLIYYLRKNTELQKSNAKFYFNNILNALLQCLFIAEIKNEGRYYSKQSLLSKFNNQELLILRSKIAQWSLKIHNTVESEYNTEVNTEVRDYIMTNFANKFGFQSKLTLNGLKVFIDNPSTVNTVDPVVENGYVYTYPENPDIKIEIGTVHSVKGETHTATLYLETFYKKYEIEKVKSNFENVPLTNPNSEEIKTIKMLHVGFSRPTHLLCYAVCKSRLNGELNGFEKIET